MAEGARPLSFSPVSISHCGYFLDFFVVFPVFIGPLDNDYPGIIGPVLVFPECYWSYQKHRILVRLNCRRYGECFSLKKFKTRSFFLSVVISFAFLAVPKSVFARGDDISVLSLDELLDLEVVSVAKVPEKITKTPAAIFIITQEDIRRSGVNTIPDALRMVPGIHVYQIDANKWAVSARGFASRFSNKMLVMVDGRTVYSPLFSGTFWDSQDLMLEDIERIEVIRGPGGTLWGANAVNGVINIIGKDTADTQGGLIKGELGSYQQQLFSARYGGWLSDRVAYRFYGKFSHRGDSPSLDGGDAADGWHQGRIGFRTDMNLALGNKVTLQGELYDGESGQSVRYLSPFPLNYNLATVDVPVSGGHLLGRWSRSFSADSEMTFQAYYDRTDRQEFLLDESLDTVDIDFQHRYNLSDKIELLWGLGYRYTHDYTSGRQTIPGVYSYVLDPQIRKDNLYSGFLQSRFTFGGDKGELTLGSKVEHNDYTGYEWQPSSRLMWNFNEMHSLWAAVSRSVRTPSRIESDANVNAGAFGVPGPLVTYVRLVGNEEVEAEKVWSYELGYRVRPSETFFLDTTIFYNYYKDLINGVPNGLPYIDFASGSPFLVLPIEVANGMDGETYGLELSAQWSVQEWWRLTAGYTLFHFNELNSGDSEEARQGFSEGENAEHRFSLISYMDLPNNFELNAALYYIDDLPELGFGSSDGVGSNLRLDVNMGYHSTDNWTVTVGGRNLLEKDTPEFSETMDGVIESGLARIFYLTVAYNF